MPVTYNYIIVAYEWYTTDIRARYEWYVGNVRVHTNGIRITY